MDDFSGRFPPPPSKPPDPPGFGQPPMGLRRRGRALLALLGVVVAAGGGLFACTHRQASPKGSPAATTNCPPITGYFESTELIQSVTAALQKHDGAAFVGLAADPAAKVAMAGWWDNVSALGFTTGAMTTEVPDQDSPAATITATIGVHNALDAVSDANSPKPPEPMAPATKYRLSVAHTGAGCAHTVITGWTALSDAPWDSTQKLYVIKTAHTVVSGEPAMRSEVDRLAPIAEKAAVWDLGFFHLLNKDRYVRQTGFVMFVPASNEQAQAWFRGKDAPKPKGWSADAGNVAGVDFPLPGVTPPFNVKADQLSALPIGGDRVIITERGRSAPDAETEATLIHEFVHDLLDVNDLWSYAAGQPPAAATVEGAARWVEAFYRSSPDAPSATMSARLTLAPVVQSHLAEFTGHVPTNAQLYGGSSFSDYYYDLAATTFAYENRAVGRGFALQCAVLAYVNSSGPFGGVITDDQGGKITFADPAQEEAKWAAWVRAGMPA